MGECNGKDFIIIGLTIIRLITYDPFPSERPQSKFRLCFLIQQRAFNGIKSR